ncbi:MAG: methyltransferase domain-containing protein [Myxococcales bacterium]|nr:methyltransferase domain-containing protein [Myxococcales bacterium]
MDAELRDRVREVLGHEVAQAEAVQGGYTPAQRWRVTLAEGGRAFVKVGTTPYTAQALRAEIAAYERLAPGPQVAPGLLGHADHPTRPLLVLEDLSDARWPPPWQEGDLDRVRATVAAVEALPVSSWPPLDLAPLASSWRRIEADPGPFLSTRMCSEAWLQAALPVLRAAEARADTAPQVVLHFDLRSDNLCVRGPAALLVDWNHAGLGPAGLDLAFMALSLRLEGGPLPDVFAPDVGDHVAWVAGHFAAAAGLPGIPDAPRVRRFQSRQLRIALPWAARVLGLPEADGDWCKAACAHSVERLARGELDEAQWYEAIEEDLVDAYLSSDDPHRGSGKSGDAEEWRWSRELVLDALPDDLQADPVRVLDVGCANGHLMACLEAWGAERGVPVEAHGLEISERLARVARRRLPQLAGRIHTGNVSSWEPAGRYHLVCVGLDYVPSARRAALVDRIVQRFLQPSGRLVLRPERVDGREPDPVQTLVAIGRPPGGVLQSAHPRTGALRRTAWIARSP